MNNLKLASVLFPVLALIGCGSPELAPAPATSDHYAPSNVVFSGQTDLNLHIAINPITRRYDSAGLLHIVVPARATTPNDLYVDYRFTYFDENHIPVDVPTAWQTKTLHSDIFETIEGNSSTPRAKDFQIDFREAQ